MARRLRLQFADAIYHIINRGNCRSDGLSRAGAGKTFELVLDEACQRYVAAAELHDFSRARRMQTLERLLREAGLTLEIAKTDAKGADWKRAIAGKSTGSGR